MNNTNFLKKGGFGGFGQKSAAGNTFGATSSAPTGFGQTPATSTGSFSFGANQPAGNAATTTTTATTGGFGSTGFSGFGSFSNPSATTMTTNVSQAKPAFGGLGSFGSNQQQQQQQQIGFGMQNLQQQQMNKPQVQEKVWQELALIRAHFDPTSPLCHFRVNNQPYCLLLYIKLFCSIIFTTWCHAMKFTYMFVHLIKMKTCGMKLFERIPIQHGKLY